jgi:hypothetical protein
VLLDIVRLNIARYRANPVIIIPPLVVLVFELVVLPLMGIPAADASGPELESYAFIGFGALFLSMAISFLALVGQASMASSVVLGGKAGLRDWVNGIRKHSPRVLGVYFIYLVVMVLSFVPMIVMYWYAMLPWLRLQIGASGPVEPPSPPFMSLPIGIAINWTAINWTALILFSVITAVAYMWLAPVFFEDADVFTSVGAGNKALRANGRAFLGFVALFIAVSGVANLIENLPVYLGSTIQQIYGSGYLAPTHVASQVIETMFSPLWFLVALTIYRGGPR